MIRIPTFRIPLMLIALLAGVPALRAQDAEAQFRKSCMSCHSINAGKKTGPDLSGLLARRDRAWAVKFITTPDAMLDSDPVAKALLAEHNNTRMPNLGITAAEADGLLKLIETYTASKAKLGAAAVVRPATPVDIAAGRALFEGRVRFTLGAPACMSCHSVNGLGGFGGGKLAPDLTGASGKFGPGLVDTIANPAFPTMAGPFGGKGLTADEAFQVAAYLQSVAGQPPAKPDLFFPVVGGVGLLAGMALGGWLGRKRLRGVRNTLIPRA